MSVAISQPTKTLSFQYGDEQITFERTKRTTNVQRVLIKVHPDCRVLALAPTSASDEVVLSAVKKRSRWIYRQLRDFRANLAHITPRQYVSGESHYYLGKQYQLKIIEAPDQAQYVKLLRGSIEVSVRHKNPDRIKALLNEWYKQKAKTVFARRLEAMLSQTLWVSDKPPLRTLTMQTQWGSCSPKGRLTLNPHLVKAPRACIDYVILHELCHIAEHNHSEQFYKLLKQVMPNWESIKERLDGMANLLLNDTGC
jgi:predicted metal-dependent hydrolase